MADEKENPGGASPTPTPTTTSGADSGAPPPDTFTSNKPVIGPQRPDWLTYSYRDYWNDEKGLDHGKLLGEFDALKSFKAEADIRAQGVPAKPGDYKIEPPADFKIPEGSQVKVSPDHPLAKPVQAWAKKHGLTQEAFSELIGLQAQGEIAGETEFNERAAAEREKLGVNAATRIDAVSRALESRIGKETAEALYPMTYTAASIEALEKLIRQSPGGSYSQPRESAREQRQDVTELRGVERFMAVMSDSPKRKAG